AQPTETPAPTATEAAAATQVPDDPDAPIRTADAWFSYWTNEDFAGMYRLTSGTTRTVISEAEFIERYQAIHAEAGIKDISGRITGEADAEGRFPYEATITSSLLGEHTDTNDMLMVEEGGEWRIAWTPSLIFSQLGDTGCVDWKGEPLRRGRILDASGDVLAEDAEVAQVGVVPGDLGDEDATISRLAEIIDMSPDDIRSIYQREGIAPEWFVPVKNLPADQAVDLINQVQGMQGVQVQRGYSRVYPEGPLFAHVTGFVSPATEEDVLADESGSVQPDQMVGKTGLEYGANEILAGKPGGKLLVVECETRAERDVIAETQGTPPMDITITIDIDFQRQVDEAVGNVDQLASIPNAPETENGEGSRERGAAVVIDPRTGAILAMVSHPTYDPNDFVTGNFTDEDLEFLNDPVLRPQANRAAGETYPPGSIFKVVTTSAAMANLGYTGETPIDCPASFSIGEQTWNDWVVENGLTAQGALTLHTGLVRSCNTVFYQIGADLDIEGANLLPDMAKAFGLGSPTGIAYFPEATGVVPDPQWKLENINDGWSTGDNVNLSIGQGYLLVSPLQMANAYAAIANGGDLLQPYIVDKATVPGTDQVQQLGERKVVSELPLTDEQIAALQSALRDQTSNDSGVGSSRIFGDFQWPIAGKTGTAQNGPQDGSVPPHSWFAAYGPAGEEATIASVVMFEQVGEGVQYAAPVTRAIYESYIGSNSAATQP
ncbi:MAG TPA: penicillin-binding transpeptidase domain-containing protein, partial [Thermomicrobiales bacterium]|nr:penicillin-binding transpeptidase domain-containing protein [Thermomicrobiales bacterium]